MPAGITMFRFILRFACSKSMGLLALYMGFAGLCSAAVGYGFHQSSLTSFRAQKSQEKVTALRLVDAFVTTYSSVRTELGAHAIVPATFRAQSIERFNTDAASGDDFVLHWVGRPGRQIKTPPSDAEMGRIIEAFVGVPNPGPRSLMTSLDGRPVFRTIYPTIAREQGCVSCHNEQQPTGPRWQLNDVMGAFAIDVPVAPFLAQIHRQSLDVGLGLFAALAALGLLVAPLHFRQARTREATDRELRALNQSLQSATKAKSEFLANMSHEIRTPMNGVFGMTDLLLKTRLSDHQYRLVSTINESAKTLLTIINDILDISRIEAGKLTLERQPIDVRLAVEGAVDLFVDQANRKGLSLSIYVAPDLPQQIVGDSGRLRQVCVNLVGNAVKFTHAGEVGLRVTLAHDTGGRETLHLEVSDTGIGMDAATVDRICRPFEQADSSIARRFGGTGLGLAISRHIVGLMGGVLDIQSAAGRGTSVHFALPLERVPGSTAVAGRTHSLDGARILVIDDRETSRAIICDYLAASGAEPTQATSVRDGLDLMHAAADAGMPFDASIVEAIMSEGNGLDFLAAIAGDPRHATLKTIVLTSMSWAGDVAEIRRRGAHGLLAKPLHQRGLVGMVSGVLDRAKVSSESGTPATAVTSSPAIPRLNSRVLLAEDNPVNIEVARTYLEEFGCSVRVAENGREAVDAHAAQGFDLILMDAQMPDLDGLSATRMIREREAAQDLTRIPIIAVTANAFAEDRARCLEAGMDDYLSKPYSEAQLASVLIKWTQALATPRSTAMATSAAIIAKLNARNPPVLPAPRRSTRISPAAPSELAAARVKVLASPQSTTLRGRMIGAYLDHTPKAHDTLRLALERCDAVALKLASHSLKSSSAGLGAHDLAKLLADIEKSADIGDLYQCTQLMAKLDPEIAGVLAALSDELLTQAAAAL